MIPSHEFSAEVVELGIDVDGFNPGNSVAVDPNIRCGKYRFCRSGEVNLCEQYQAVGVTRGGQVLLFGVYPKDNTVPISPFDVILNNWRISGSFTYRNEFTEAVRLLDSEVIDVKPLVDVAIPLEDTPDMLKRFAEGEAMGKVQVVSS